MTRLTVCADAEAAAAAAAAVLARAVRPAAQLVLAGGSTPRRAYELLAGLVDDWGRVSLWLSDERVVAADDPDSNERMVREALGPAAAGAVRRVETEHGAAAAALVYGAAVPPGLDVALLGLGEDGHTASLFPDHPALAERHAPCVAVYDAPKPPPERVTLTVRALASAREIVFLAVGEGKRAAVVGALGDPTPAIPASLLGGKHTELIVDRAAAP